MWFRVFIVNCCFEASRQSNFETQYIRSENILTKKTTSSCLSLGYCKYLQGNSLAAGWLSHFHFHTFTFILSHFHTFIFTHFFSESESLSLSQISSRQFSSCRRTGKCTSWRLTFWICENVEIFRTFLKKVKWWKQKRGGGKCAGIRSGGGVSQILQNCHFLSRLYPQSTFFTSYPYQSNGKRSNLRWNGSALTTWRESSWSPLWGEFRWRWAAHLFRMYNYHKNVAWVSLNIRYFVCIIVIKMSCVCFRCIIAGVFAVLEFLYGTKWAFAEAVLTILQLNR